MLKTLLKLHLLGAIAILFVGCPSAQDLSDQLFKDLSTEAAEFQALAQVSTKEGDVSVNQLAKWSEAVSRVNDSVARVVSKLESKPDQKGGVEDDLKALRGELDKIYGRSAEMRLSVPSWSANRARRAAADAESTLRELRNNYRKLYNTLPEDPRIVVDVQEDPRFYDTYNDCVARVTMAAGLLDQAKDVCVEYAQRECGHQIDMTCIDHLILAQSSLVNALNGSICAELEWGEDQYGNSVLSSKRARTWLSSISDCQSKTPVYRNR